MLYFPKMHRESGMCYGILKRCTVLRNMMFAWKVEICLEICLEKFLKIEILGKIIEVHWKSEICIGKWFLGKTWTLENRFWDLELLYWENRFENSEKMRKFIGKWLFGMEIEFLGKWKLWENWFENMGFWNLRI